MARAPKILAGALGLAVLAGLVRLNSCATPLATPPLRRASPPPVVDARLGLARAHAPWILKEIHPVKGRQDLPAPVDFDGDLNGENAWENFSAHELLPTVYYAVVGTETHWFLTYHLYHPRDWTHVDLGLHLTHENDGENLQVVVERSSGAVVALFTQAHYRGGAYAPAGAGFGDGAHSLRGAPTLVDDAGRPSPSGTHPVVFVEQGGHGIYGVPDRSADASIAPDGRVSFGAAGRVLRPARPGESVAEPALHGEAPVPYRLESLPAKLWPALRDGSLVGEGRLLDGAVPYADDRRALDLPRYYEADRFSGPFGPDRGISPFAVDFGFRSPNLGALLFDPGRRWAEVLAVPEPWGVVVTEDPFSDG